MDEGHGGSTAEPARSKRRSGTSITLAFAGVGAAALLITLLAITQARSLQSGARVIASNVLSSVRLLGRLDNQLQKRRILVDDHIFTTDVNEMTVIETRIRTVDHDVAATSRAYEPWATLPGEPGIWERTRADLAALDAPTTQALAFSRRNQDVDARRLMDQISAQWESVEQISTR